MRAILLVVLIMALPAWAVAAEKPPKEPAPPLKPTKANPCAAYGAGFIKVEGTSTCIKVGGSVDVEAGSHSAH